MHYRRLNLKLLAILILLLAITAGCIPVENFGKFWSRGVIDSQLKGDWKSIEDANSGLKNNISFVKDNNLYKVKMYNPDTPAKPEDDFNCITLNVGSSKFLMVDSVKAFQKIAPPQSDLPFKGILQRYSIKNGILTFYVINGSILSEDMKAGKVKGTVLDANQNTGLTPFTAILKEPQIDYLSKICNDEKYWPTKQNYQRVQDMPIETKKTGKK